MDGPQDALCSFLQGKASRCPGRDCDWWQHFSHVHDQSRAPESEGLAQRSVDPSEPDGEDGGLGVEAQPGDAAFGLHAARVPDTSLGEDRQHASLPQYRQCLHQGLAVQVATVDGDVAVQAGDKIHKGGRRDVARAQHLHVPRRTGGHEDHLHGGDMVAHYDEWPMGWKVLLS